MSTHDKRLTLLGVGLGAALGLAMPALAVADETRGTGASDSDERTNQDPLPPRYTLFKLDSLGGDGTVAHGINNNGDIVGDSTTVVNGSAETHAFLYQHSTQTMTLLPSVPNGFLESASGINDHGKIAGTSITFTSGPQAVAWYVNGGFELLPLQSFANGISNNGQVVGDTNNGHADPISVLWSWKPVLHAEILGVLWVDPRLPSYGTSDAVSINDRGDIVGWSIAGIGSDPNTAYSTGVHAYLYRSGQMKDLGTLTGTNGNSFANGLNNSDDVVGYSDTNIASTVSPCPTCKATHAFLWHRGALSDLGNLAHTPGWDSSANAINDRGQIVGWAQANVSGMPTQRAFVYILHRMYNLTFVVYARDLNVRLTDAVGITCHGWIAANGYDIRSPDVPRAYLLIPKGASSGKECPRVR